MADDEATKHDAVSAKRSRPWFIGRPRASSAASCSVCGTDDWPLRPYRTSRTCMEKDAWDGLTGACHACVRERIVDACAACGIATDAESSAWLEFDRETAGKPMCGRCAGHREVAWYFYVGDAEDLCVRFDRHDRITTETLVGAVRDAVVHDSQCGFVIGRLIIGPHGHAVARAKRPGKVFDVEGAHRRVDRRVFHAGYSYGVRRNRRARRSKASRQQRG